MSEIAAKPYTQLDNPLVDQAWETLGADAEKYGKQFSVPVEQDTLPGIEDDKQHFKREYVRTFLSEHPGFTGGGMDFVTWEIAGRACLAGLLGGIYLGRELSQSEKWLYSERIQNPFSSEPVPTDKMSGRDYYVRIYNPEELARVAAYYYKVGASDRLDGTWYRRELDTIHDDLGNEWPLLSSALEGVYTGEYSFLGDKPKDNDSENYEYDDDDEGPMTEPFSSRYADHEPDGGVVTRNYLRQDIFDAVLKKYPVGWDFDETGWTVWDDATSFAEEIASKGFPVKANITPDQLRQLHLLVDEILTYGVLTEEGETEAMGW